MSSPRLTTLTNFVIEPINLKRKNEITNEFLIVTNKKDQKGLIKLGNERVVEARLNDAEFFWNKDKSQNLVKKVSELKSLLE